MLRWRRRQHETRLAKGSELKVLLVGINYDPELAGIGPYTSGLARHWASEGHTVTVVTGVPHYPQWHRDPIQAKGAEPGNPRIQRYNHFIPRRPRALGRSLYEVTWLFSALRAVTCEKPDLVIGVVPSLSGAVLAWVFARKHGMPFGIIFQDLIGSAALQSGYTGGKRLAWLASRVELSIARRAAWVAIVADGFRSYLEAGGVTSARIFRVRNWAGIHASTTARNETRTKLDWPSDAFVCLHAGNMGQKQALDNLLLAARQLGARGMIFVLAGDGNDRERLVEKARNLKLTNVQFVGVQPGGFYESMLEAADVLLLNQRPSVSDMALPSKLSSYFAASKPVVAAVASDSEAAREVRLAGGVVVAPGDPSGLARELSRLWAAPAERFLLGQLARNYFDRCLDQRPALEQYDRILCSAGGSARDEAGSGRGGAVETEAPLLSFRDVQRVRQRHHAGSEDPHRDPS